MNSRFRLFTFLFLLISTVNFGQSCFPNGITFTNQTEIDLFKFNFPNCTEIGGNLIIDEQFDHTISNLAGLDVITTIEGDLWLSQNKAIANLEGLENLEHIGGQLNLYNNPNLRNVDGLEGLEVIDGELSVTANNKLTNLEGLNNLREVGQVFLFANDALVTLTGFDNITSIPGDLWFDNMDGLEEVHAFQNLDTVYGDFILELNANIHDLSGFQNLKYIGKSFDIHGHDSLLDLTGFTSLVHIGERVLMTENNAIQDMTGLGALRYVGEDFWVWYHDALLSFDGLYNLDTIEGDLAVSNLAAITSLQGFENLKHLGMDLEITRNDKIETLHGLDLLDSIRQKLEIRDNPLLANIDGLEKFNGIGGFVLIESNPNLQNVEGFAGLKNIGSHVKIENNGRLRSLDGMDSLQHTNGYLEINNCDSLESMLALAKLDSIRGDLTISNNQLLSSLDGLHNIDPLSIESFSMTYPDLFIVNNPALSECAILSICGAFDRPELSFNISGNDDDCNSKPIIENQCSCDLNLLVELERDTLCLGGQTMISLSNLDDPLLEFEWFPSLGLDDPFTQNPIASPLQTTTYIVVVFDPTKGCYQETDVTVAVGNTSIDPFDIQGLSSICIGDSTELFVDQSYDSYNWSTGEMDPSIFVNNAATYTLTVTDQNGCTGSSQFAVDALENPEVTINALGAPNFCMGDSVFLNVDDDYASYLWNTGDEGTTISALKEGDYSITVTNDQGCPATASISVIVYPGPTVEVSVTHESALGANNGSAIANTSTGQEPFTYIWSSGDDTKEVMNLSPDTYTVTVTDLRGCTDVQEFTINPFVCQNLQAQINQTDISCYDACDGMISIEDIANGTPPYAFSFDGNVNPSLEDLCADTYFLTITDAANCTLEQEITLTQPDEQVVTIDSTFEVTTMHGGAIYITASGDNSYLWNGPSDYISTNEDITDLNEGCYTVLITDNNSGCTTDTTICILVSGIDEALDQTSINIFPNPSTGYLTIDTPVNSEVESLVILSTSGSLVTAMSYPKEAIDLHHLSSGTYIIKALINGTWVYRRWVKI